MTEQWETTGGPGEPGGQEEAVGWSGAVLASPLAVAVLDRDTFAIRGLSSAFGELTGLPTERLLGRPLPNLLPEAGAERMRSALVTCRDTGTPARAPDLTYTHPQYGPVALDCALWTFPRGEEGGNGLAVHASMEPNRPLQRGLLSLQADRVRAANEQLVLAGLRQIELAEQSRLRAHLMDELVASQAAGVLVVDGEGEVVLANGPARQMLDLPAPGNPALAQRLRELELQRPDGSPLPPAERPLARLLRGEHFSDVELRLPHPGGEALRIAFNGSAITDAGPSGVSLGILVCNEVTAKRRLEDLRADYIALISHDLRAPLNTILGYAELVRLALERGLADETAGWIERIEHATREMAAMIDDLVESTRLESGTPHLSRALVDLKALTILAVAQLPARQDRDRLVVEAPPHAIRVNADTVRLTRAITNLVSNALKYSPPDAQVAIRIREGAGEVILSVADRGPGLSPESLPRLFQRFYRVDPGARVEGMGLGLYIARLIAEAHGGRIWAESAPGQGSTFSVALPIA